jgi:hypothetical protein
MKFKFKIQSVTHLAAAKIYALDGILESGTVQADSEGVIRKHGQSIKVKSVALVNAPTVGSNRFTLSIEEPSFPLSQITQGMLLEG